MNNNNTLSSIIAAITGSSANPNMSYPQTLYFGDEEPVITSAPTTVAAVQPAARTVPTSGVSNPKNTQVQEVTVKEGTESFWRRDWKDFSAKEIAAYAKGTADLMAATSAFTNGFIKRKQYHMQANTKIFEAEQNERASALMLRNIRDISRQGQMDANVYKEEGRKTRAAQKSAMAESGFAVGKGDYAATLDTTDTRTNYNVQMLNLKTSLQIAETKRKAGYVAAQAIVNRADADILKKQAEMEKEQGIVNSLGLLLSAAANFVTGYSEWNTTTVTVKGE